MVAPYLSSHRFRVVQFNVENLFVLLDHQLSFNLNEGPRPDFSTMTEYQWQKLSISTIPNKPLDQVKALARSIRELKPDILMLCEVGGRESLVNFNAHFLGDEFVPFLIEGNSDRGIDLGYLVRKDLPLKYDLISHKHRAIDFLYPHERLSHETGYPDKVIGKVTSHRFSRDVLELRLFDAADSKPALILLLVHLKSQLDRDRIDPMGRDRRKAELEKLVKIYHEIEQEFSHTVPILLGGDFNGSALRAKPDPEFAALIRDTHLEDVLELAQVPLEDRYTHMQIYPNRQGLNRQIDYIFASPLLHKKVVANGCFVYRFQDELGMPMLRPRNMTEKKLLPSDHYPVVATFENISALKVPS